MMSWTPRVASAPSAGGCLHRGVLPGQHPACRCHIRLGVVVPEPVEAGLEVLDQLRLVIADPFAGVLVDVTRLMGGALHPAGAPMADRLEGRQHLLHAVSGAGLV